MSREKRKDKVFPLQVKIPVGLHQSLKVDAVRNKVSLREECIARLYVKRTTAAKHKEDATAALEEVSSVLSNAVFPIHAVTCRCNICNEKRMR